MQGASEAAEESADVTQGGQACVVCFERFVPASRTVRNGATQHVRVKPFLCRHDVCGVCDEALKARGNGRCPSCREERVERLPNDTREQASADNTVPLWTDSQWHPSATSVLALASFPGQRRILRMELEQLGRRRIEEEEEQQQEQAQRDQEAGAFEGASQGTSRPRSGAGRGTATRIRQADQDLIGYLLDPVNTSISQFASMLQRPSDATTMRVVRFRPYNP